MVISVKIRNMSQRDRQR